MPNGKPQGAEASGRTARNTRRSMSAGKGYSRPRLLKASALGVMALLALTACNDVELLAGLQDPLPEDTPTRLALPPEFTPTPTAQAAETVRYLEDEIVIEPVATVAWTGAPVRSSEGVLSEGGPWLLYCDQDRELALTNLNGSRRFKPGRPCLSSEWIAGEAGFGIGMGGLVQLPEGERVRVVYGEPSIGWSPDLRYFPVVNAGMIGGEAELLVYDLKLDRLRQLDRDVIDYLPMGWSPDSRWLIHSEYSNWNRGEGLPAQVWAISPETGSKRQLYEISDGDYQQDFILGWLSPTSFIAARAVEFCDIELIHVNVASREAKQLYGVHRHAAIDPRSGTVLLVDPAPGGVCQGEGPTQGLMRMTTAGDWAPQPLSLPSAWGDDLAVRRIEWHASLGQFALWVEPDAPGERGSWARLITMTLAGRIQLEFLIADVEDPTFGGFYPSPDGRYVLVGSSRPASGRLYDARGELVAEITSGSPRHVQWLPDSSAFFIVPRGTHQLYRADEATRWAAIMVDNLVHGDYGLQLVEPPTRPFYPVCEGRHFTRLYPGDEVLVSDEPPLASRLRGGPGLTAEPQVDALFPGERAEILGGPVCADSLLWWRLLTLPERLTGWAAEGDAAGAWLLPVQDAVPPGVETQSPIQPQATQSAPAPTWTPIPTVWRTPTPMRWTPAPTITGTPTCLEC